MTRLPSFQYIEQSSLEEACSFMEEHGRESKVIAGGTDLLPSLKLGNTPPRYVVNIAAVPGLDEIAYDAKSGLCMGALARLSSIEKSSSILQNYTALAHAAAVVGSPQLREMGTLGGNLLADTRCLYYNQPLFWRGFRPKCIKTGGETCNALPGGRRCFAAYSGDLAPALIAFGGRATLVSARGERMVPVEELYTGDGAAPFSIRPEELLTRIDLPPAEGRRFSSYAKFAMRNAIDFPLASVCCVLTRDPGGNVHSVSIAMSGVGSKPAEVKGVGALLSGKVLTPEKIEEAARLAFSAARPIGNRGSSPSYRKRMVQVMVRRALTQHL